MKHFTKTFTKAVVAVGTSAMILSAAALASHSWSTYHWARTANPMPLKVVDSVTNDWQFEYETAIDEWNQSSALNMTTVAADDGSRTRKRCSMVAGQMRVCNAAYGQNGWLGLASIGLDSNGHIDQGTAKMNDSYSSYWTADEKRHVMCQEIGHVFGLGHTSEDGSSQMTCMDYSQDPQSISPNQHDYQMLSDIYGHLDSYNSYDDGSSTGDKPCRGKKCGFGANTDIPKGQLVRKSGRHEMWVAPRSDGGLWIHHVYLVDGHNGH